MGDGRCWGCEKLEAEASIQASMTERGTLLQSGDDPPAICPDRGGGPSIPLPSPSEAFVLHPHRAATLPGFSSGWVSTVWCHRPLPGRPFAAVAGHCSFFGRWMPTAESHDEKWHMEGNVDRWLSCLLASLPAVGPLLWKQKGRKAAWGLRLLPLSGLHRRLYSVQTPCPITPHCRHWSQVSRTP